MVIAGFRHVASRDQDPQLHTHAVIANMTRTAAGEWRSVEPTRIRRSEKLIDSTAPPHRSPRLTLPRLMIKLKDEVDKKLSGS